MNVLILGAGSVGTTIAQMLLGTGDYDVVIADQDAASLARLPAAVASLTIDASDEDAVRQALSGR
ncbi:MAG: saccharopine dehydrogenase NADP-binding domain-containing protein, partial [Clostridia bacterium]